MNSKILPQLSPVSPLQATPIIDLDAIPCIFGQQDAQRGERCVPEMYFINPADKIEYCRGYESVAGANETTRYFLEN